MEQKKKIEQKQTLKLVKEKDTLEYTPHPIEDLSKEKDHFKKIRDEKSSLFIPHQDFQSLNSIGFNRREFEGEISKRVEEKLSGLQKSSEEKAYQVGLKMGESKALEMHSEDIKKSIQSLHSIVQSLQEKETQFFFENKAQILKITFEIAKKIAMQEISENKEGILKVMEKVFEQLESDSKMIIYLSPEDKKFIESVQGGDWNEIKTRDFKKMTFKSSSEVKSGGCVVETDYARIDASLKTRIEEVWNALYKTLEREKEEKIEKN